MVARILPPPANLRHRSRPRVLAIAADTDRGIRNACPDGTFWACLSGKNSVAHSQTHCEISTEFSRAALGGRAAGEPSTPPMAPHFSVRCHDCRDRFRELVATTGMASPEGLDGTVRARGNLLASESGRYRHCTGVDSVMVIRVCFDD